MEFINKEKLNDFGQFLQREYYQKGFGMMTKTEVEVMMFYALLEYGHLTNKSDFEISRFLRIPQSKVQRLRYESSLKYLSNDEFQLRKRLYSILLHAKYEAHKNQISFSIEDKFLRKWYESKVIEKYGFIDTSFNTSIIKIEKELFVEILDSIYTIEQSTKKIKEDIKKSINYDKYKGMLESIKENISAIGSLANILPVIQFLLNLQH